MKRRMAKLISDARAKNALTQTQVSKAIGLQGPQYISNVERGTAPLSVTHFKTISKVLKVPLADLLSAHAADYQDLVNLKVGAEK